MSFANEKLELRPAQLNIQFCQREGGIAMKKGLDNPLNLLLPTKNVSFGRLSCLGFFALFSFTSLPSSFFLHLLLFSI
jgi:hypothetical protein